MQPAQCLASDEDVGLDLLAQASQEGLSIRLQRPRRSKAAKLRQPKQLAHAINGIWSMDFVADALFDGREMRMLTVVNLFTRECRAIEVGQSL